MKRDIRPYVYAALDTGLAAIYAVLLVSVLPVGHAGPSGLLWALVACDVVMAAGMLVRHRWGWRVAAGMCGLMLLLELVLLVLLVVSAAFLAGVYGSFGKGAALLTLVAAFLSLQLVALVPALQLKFLLTRAGRRHYGVG
jgi:hypothetical protein